MAPKDVRGFARSAWLPLVPLEVGEIGVSRGVPQPKSTRKDAGVESPCDLGS